MAEKTEDMLAELKAAMDKAGDTVEVRKDALARILWHFEAYRDQVGPFTDPGESFVEKWNATTGN